MSAVPLRGNDQVALNATALHPVTIPRQTTFQLDSMNPPPLIVRCGALGDMVLLTPLIHALAQRYGQPVDLLTSGPWSRPLLAHDPAVGHLQLLTSRKTPYWLCPSQWRAVHWLKSRGRGPVYLCDRGTEIRALLQRAGVMQEDIVDYFDLPEPLQAGSEQWPDQWLAFAKLDPVSAPPGRPADPSSQLRVPRLTIDDRSREELSGFLSARGMDGPLVLLQPGNKRTHKRGRTATRQHNKFWPAENWAAVAAGILADLPDATVVLCGSAPEFGLLEDIRACARDPRVRNLARELPIPRLLAMTERAHSFVSVDSGPAHVAAALGCPLVVLFGAAPISMWKPIGSAPVVVLGGAKGPASRVEDIQVAEVLAAWRSLLPVGQAPG